MNKIKKLKFSPQIQISLAAGVSIIVLAYFSKRVLPEALSYLELAIPPFLATVYEAATKKRKAAWYGRPVVGILAILLATVLVIVLNA